MTGTPQGPRGSAETLDTVYDVALLDLDGTVYLGGAAIPGAAEALGEHARGGLGGCDHVLRRGGDAEAGQQLGDGGRGAEGVVGHVGQPHARRRGLAERLGRSGDRGAAQVDGPVQVEQRDVVGGVEGLGAAPRRGWGARHRASSCTGPSCAGPSWPTCAGPSWLTCAGPAWLTCAGPAWSGRASSWARRVARTDRRASV